MISHRDGGVEVYYDSRHKVIKTPLSGGGFAELVQVRQPDGSYRDQMLSISRGSIFVEYPDGSERQ
jgi:hypothetical protein